MHREKILLNGITKKDHGLEIGPSFRPLAKKKDGYNVKIVDHLSTQALIEKYKQHGVDISQIEEVDFVFNGESLPKLVNYEKFDYILASHVIEHVPDLISFLQDCECIMHSNSSLNLAIPDKRYCFDIHRECSSLSRAIDIFQMKPKHQTVGAAAEYFLLVSKLNGNIAWDKTTTGKIDNVHSTQDALNAIESTRQGVYLDIHNWVFTPDSFLRLLHQLNQLNYTRLVLKSYHDTIGCEFYVILSKK